MTYRPITQDEIPTVAEIKARAFRQELAHYLDRLREGGRTTWREQRLLENAAGQPVATLTVFEREMSLNGGGLNAGLIGGVAVSPDQRRRGYASRVMNGLLQELYERELPISLLYPFSVAYYHRLGYGLVSLNHYLDVPPRNLPDYPEHLDARRATDDDRGAIRACYERARRRPEHNGWFLRTDWEWDNRVWKENYETMVYPAKGEIEGYLIYELNWGANERPLKIVEWVSATDAAWRGLVGHLTSLGEQATVVSYNGPRNDPLSLALREPYSAVGGGVEFIYYQAARLIAGSMLRVVHLPTALRTRRYLPETEAHLLLRVEDPQLPANGQPLHVHIAGGAASVAPANSLFPDEPLTGVETDIATFGQLFAGFVSAEQARTTGRLRADDATCALLTQAFAAAPLFLHQADWF